MRIKAPLIAFAAVAGFGLAGAAGAQGMPTTPSTGPSSGPSSTSPSSPSSEPSGGSSATGSGYLSTPAKGSDHFTKLDKDKDSMVSKDEAKKNKELAKQFDSLDTNKDGKLDQAEFSAFEAAQSSKSMNR